MTTLESPLDVAHAQLKYWREERQHSLDERRIIQCDRFIRQCEMMISALEPDEPPRRRARRDSEFLS